MPLNETGHLISRRTLMRTVASASALTPILGSSSVNDPQFPKNRGAAHSALLLDQDWRFGQETGTHVLEPDFDDRRFSAVTLPHCVTQLSWQNWDPALWQRAWTYRRHFDVPREFRGLRLFLHFDSVMIAATVAVNGHVFPQHLGGFLPFRYEITDLVHEGENVLALGVDAGWKNVPPEGSPKGPPSIDYLLPGGITGSVHLSAVPKTFIDDVFAKPLDVLGNPRLEVKCSLNASTVPPDALHITATLLDGSDTVASASKELRVGNTGETE